MGTKILVTSVGDQKSLFELITVVVKNEMATEYKVWANHIATMRMGNADSWDGLFLAVPERVGGEEGREKGKGERGREDGGTVGGMEEGMGA